MLRLFFGRGAALGPGDDAFHLRAEVVLGAFLVAQVGTVDGDGGEDLEDAVDEDPAAASRFEGVEGFDLVGLFEADKVCDQVGVHVLVAEGVDVGGFGVGEGLFPGLGEDVGGGGGFLKREGGFGFRLDGDRGGCYWVRVRDVGKFVAVVEAQQDVGEGELKGVGAEILAGAAGDGPFLAWPILGAIEHYVTVDEVVVQAVEIVLKPPDHVSREPGLVITRRPVQEGIFVVFAEPLP